MATGDDFAVDYTNKRIYHKPDLLISKAWSYNGNTAVYTDETTDINEATINDVALPPIQAIALGLGDAIYVGEDGKLSKLRLKVGTVGVYSGITLQWQYWNGASWSLLTVNDGTSFFTIIGESDVTWTPPTDWATKDVNGVTKYWVRCVVTAHNTPVVTTAPLGTQGWETTIYTVRQLYSWIMDNFDEQATIDDTIPMSAQTPTEYTMVNSWFIDDVSTHFLKGGAIKTDGYLNNIQVAPFGATYTNCIAADIGKMVQDDSVDAGALLDYNNTKKKWWVRTGSGTPIANGSVMFIPNAVNYAQFYNGNTLAWTDETADINNATINDVLLPPQQITSVGDTIYFGDVAKFGRFRLKYDTVGVYSGITLQWQYWNGAWVALSVTDPTNFFTAAAGTYNIAWAPPADWVTTAVNGVTKYWVRCTVTTLTTPSITTAPLGSQGWVSFGAGTTNADSVDGEDLSANIYTLGTIEASGVFYISQDGAVVGEADDWWNPDGHIDILFKVKEAGTEIAGAVITVYLRVYTDLYDFYEIDLTEGGRNAVPVATFNDPDNQTAVATVMNYLDTIQVMFANGELAYTGKAGNDPIKHMSLHDQTSHATALLLNTGGGAGATGTFELADVEGTFGNTNTIEICEEIRFDAQATQFVLGETIKNAANGSTKTAIVRKIIQDPQASGIEGIVFVTDVTGSWVDNDPIYSGATQRATQNGAIVTNTFTATVNGTITIDNQISKDLDNGAGAQPYNIVVDLNAETVAHMYEVLKGLTHRQCTIQLYTCNDVSIAKLEGRQYQRAMSTYALKKASPIGTFAGGKFFGARGVWIEAMASADSQAYSLIDALGATQNPPTMSTIRVVAMVATNDRVLVSESTGTGLKVIKKNQYTLTSQTNQSYIEVSGAIADDAPTTGVVRVVVDYGLLTQSEDIYTYTSINRVPANDQFILAAPTGKTYDSGDRAYNPYIDANADGAGEREVTVKYSGGTKYIVAIVRYKGYVPFDVAGNFPSAGVTVTAIRTTDSIYQA